MNAGSHTLGGTGPGRTAARHMAAGHTDAAAAADHRSSPWRSFGLAGTVGHSRAAARRSPEEGIPVAGILEEGSPEEGSPADHSPVGDSHPGRSLDCIGRNRTWCGE